MIIKYSLSIFYLGLLYSFSGMAQIPQPVIATAKYNLIHVKDTNNRSVKSMERWVLYLGKSATSFQSYDKLVRDSIMLGRLSTNQALNGGLPGKVTSTSFYYFSDEKKHFRKEQLLNNYVYPLNYPNYNWKIYPEKKKISGLVCQKATGSWKGRSYIVWFCPEIPFNYGPWNMQGLPGLIIEASDLKKEVIFEFAGFKKNEDSSKEISLPKVNLVMISEQRYRELYKLSFENPQAFLKLYGLTANIQGKPVRNSSFNNPIELSTK